MWAETSHIEQNTQLHIWQNTNHENSDIILISSRRIELLHICIKSNISQLCHTAEQTHAHGSNNHLCSYYQNKFKAAAKKGESKSPYSQTFISRINRVLLMELGDL